MPAYYRILNHTKKEYFDLEALRAANGNALSGVGEGLLVSWPTLAEALEACGTGLRAFGCRICIHTLDEKERMSAENE